MTITFLISSDILIAKLSFPLSLCFGKSASRVEKCDKGGGGYGEGKCGRREGSVGREGEPG